MTNVYLCVYQHHAHNDYFYSKINNAIFSLNKDGASGLYGFNALFFKTYRYIIKNDVISVIIQFFVTNWILPNFNDKIIALIPITLNTDCVCQFKPVALEIFKCNIISKILDDKLVDIMPYIFPNKQRGFIRDIQIKDCICLTSEALKLLHNKSLGGNLALKVDITKYFDTLYYNFLLKVLAGFSFNDKFCKWI